MQRRSKLSFSHPIQAGRRAAVVVPLVMAGMWLAPQVAQAVPLHYYVTNTHDSGAGSLRQAILVANAHPGHDVIDFDFAGAGPWTISVATALPAITDPVTIDASTVSGYAGSPLVDLD